MTDTWSFRIAPAGWIMIAFAALVLLYGWLAGANLDDTQQRTPLTTPTVTTSLETP